MRTFLFSVLILLTNYLLFSQQCPTVGFYTATDKKLLNQVSPVNCSYEVWLVHYSVADAKGFVGPGFSFIVTTDAFSNTNNSFEIQINGNPIGGLAPSDPGWQTYLGPLPVSTTYTIYTINGTWNPNAVYTFKWCDNCNNGCGNFPYRIYDHADVIGNDHNTAYLFSTPTLSGTFAHTTPNQCFEVVLDSLKGIASFSGPGITNDIGSGRAKFNAALAGPGTHTITYCWDNQNGCSSCSSQQITVIGPTANAGSNHEICLGDSVQIGGIPSATGGTGNNTYTYQWSPATGLSNPSISNPYASPTETTTYQLIVKDHNGAGCKDTAFVDVVVHPVPEIQIQASATSICLGDTVVLELIQNNDFSYLWSYNNNQTNSIIVSPNQTQTYSVTVTNQFGCSVVDSVTIDVFENLNVTITPDSIEICDGEIVTFYVNSNGNNPEFIWSTLSQENFITVNPSITTTYYVDAIDDNACTGSAEVLLTVHPMPDANFYTIPEIGKTYDPNITFYSTSNAQYWFWDFGDGNTSNSTPPVFHTYPDVEETYTVTLVLSNDFGCTDSIVKLIQIIDDILIFSNVITPNGDGINDVLEISNANKYPNNRLVVFNRWGKIVFEQTNYTNNWSGEGLADGTYFYIFYYLDKAHHSSLTILRQ